MDHPAIRRLLARWYDRNRRDLPWRRTRDPYAIWMSEVMLQQTRVAAVIPYYEKFLERFPTPRKLADAPEAQVLTMWEGLGYYSRARNFQKAARQVAEFGEFPRDYDAIRKLAGVGDYTAAAVASIAFGLPYAVVDGNVKRVIARLSGDALVDVPREADALLDRRNPARSNQALMELGATVCVPRGPRCEACPLRGQCAAYKLGLQAELPVKRAKVVQVRKERTLLVIRKQGKMLLVPSPRVDGFWDLPEPFPGVRLGAKLGKFRHAITNSQYLFEVQEASCKMKSKAARWWVEKDLHQIPLSTASKKALACLGTV